uniref:Uncharacterized protein AlNc14C65G4646 n=1 Tax=Albugo laibachii Nc14 TaxID=890382 RepID=F0WDC6_9STRA|nr:hypothetical protein PITG_04060 [Albugo laibachii Nc14]|eukprot:CCA19198.1 hypothetical protein PITG_04060 [Albugo laibachii Nc14]
MYVVCLYIVFSIICDSAFLKETPAKMLSFCTALNTCFCFAAQICSQLVIDQGCAMLRVQELVTKKSLSPTVIEAHKMGQAIANAKVQSNNDNIHLDPRHCLAKIRKTLLDNKDAFNVSSVLQIHFSDSNWDSRGSVSEVLKVELYNLQKRILSSNVSFKSCALVQLYTEEAHVPASLMVVLFFFLSSETNSSKFLLYLCPGRVKVLKNLETVYKRLEEESESLAQLNEMQFRMWSIKYRDFDNDTKQPVENGRCLPSSNNDEVEISSTGNQNKLAKSVSRTSGPYSDIGLEHWKNNNFSRNSRSLSPTPVQSFNEVQQMANYKTVEIDPIEVEDTVPEKADPALRNENFPSSDAENLDGLDIVKINDNRSEEACDNNDLTTNVEEPREMTEVVRSLEVAKFDENAELSFKEATPSKSIFCFLGHKSTSHLSQANEAPDIAEHEFLQSTCIGNDREVLADVESNRTTEQLLYGNNSNIRQLGDADQISSPELILVEGLHQNFESISTSESSRVDDNPIQDQPIVPEESQCSKSLTSNESAGSIRLARDHYRSKLGKKVWWELEYQSRKLENTYICYARRRKALSTGNNNNTKYEVKDSRRVERVVLESLSQSEQESEKRDTSDFFEYEENSTLRKSGRTVLASPKRLQVGNWASLRGSIENGSTNQSQQEEGHKAKNTNPVLLHHQINFSHGQSDLQPQATLLNTDSDFRQDKEPDAWASNPPFSSNIGTIFHGKAPDITLKEIQDNWRSPYRSSNSLNSDAVISGKTIENRVHELRAKRLAQLSKEKKGSHERAEKVKCKATDISLSTTKDDGTTLTSRHNHMDFLRQKSSAAVPSKASREVTVLPRRLKKASNRQLVQNAIEFTLLAGAALEKERKAVLTAIAASSTDNFIVLLKSAKELKFRALYEHHLDSNEVKISHGPSNAPQVLVSSEIGQFFRYNSGKKEFMPVDTRSFTIKTDACALLDHLIFRRKKTLPSSIY